MKYRVLHSSQHRFHLDLCVRRLTQAEADTLYYTLMNRDEVENVQVFVRTAQMIVKYRGQSEKILLEYIGKLSLKTPELQEFVPAVSSRATNDHYKEKLINMVMIRMVKKFLLPAPIRIACTVYDGAPFIWHGIKDLLAKKFSAEIVHASAIAASMLIGDFAAASSITFLTEVGEELEEWTYKKSVDDLAQSLALNVSKVWRVEGPGVVRQVGIGQIQIGDVLQVSMGSVIPLDGTVTNGEAMINQAALTGESVAVRKTVDSTVFAGTVVEEGEILIEVRQTSGKTRYDRIVKMIEESESLKSITQSQAERVVSKLIPYTFGAAVATLILTRNVTKAASVLMVDFSCAIEVEMPISVLSAMREAGKHRITVKGGKYLEDIAAADTVVFDKTGTLTKATPVVEQVVAMEGYNEDEMLRIAACLEEHFPHSLANAVVRAAKEKNLEHEEMHSRVVYIVAHGVATTIGDERAVIGSYHFVFEDEKCVVMPEDQDKLELIPSRYSHLYMAIGGKLVAIIGIADPIKEESKEVIADLKDIGLTNIVMMTGDSDRTAKAVAEELGITQYYAEVLPEDKAKFVDREKKAGHTVIMIGDGINDSPALSMADVGIAMKEGADIAQEIADITLSGSDLKQLVALRQLGNGMMERMKSTSRIGIGFNAGILVAGILGLVVPGTAAFLHNASTIALCLRNMNDLLPSDMEIEEEAYTPVKKEELAEVELAEYVTEAQFRAMEKTEQLIPNT